MRLLGTLLIVAGLTIWAMMHYTPLGYDGWGSFLVVASVLFGITFVTSKRQP